MKTDRVCEVCRFRIKKGEKFKTYFKMHYHVRCLKQQPNYERMKQ